MPPRLACFPAAADKEARDIWSAVDEGALEMNEVDEVMADAIEDGTYSQVLQVGIRIGPQVIVLTK